MAKKRGKNEKKSSLSDSNKLQNTTVQVKEEIKPDKVVADNKIDVAVNSNNLEKKKKRKKFMFGVVLILSIVLVIVVINAMGLFVRKQSEIEMPLVYVSNGELKFISSRKKESSSVGTFSSDKLGIIRYPNRSDKYIMYTEGSDLYLSYVRSNKDTKNIAGNVLKYYFSANDKHIVYIDLNGNLFVNDFNKSEELDKGVSLVLDVTEDKVYYQKDGNLYSKSLKASKNDRIKIATDYYVATMNSDCSKILYAKESGDEIYDYYVYNIKRKKEQKVLTDVFTLYDYNDDFTEFIYGSLNKDNAMDLNNFVNDDKKEYDENFKTYSFDDYWNGKIDYDTYKQSQKDSDNVVKRQKIRDELAKEAGKTLKGAESIDVYYQKSNKKLKLADAISKVSYTDLKNKRLIYSKDDYSSIEKLDINEIDSVADIKEHVVSNLKNVVFYKYGQSEESEITSNKSSVIAHIFGDEIYCEADDEIFYAKLKKNKMGEVKSVANNAIVVDWENRYEDGLLFLEGLKNGNGELKLIKNGKVNSIDSNVYEKDIVVTGNKVYYFKDYKNYNGNYYSYSGRPKRIMSDVSRVSYIKENYMYVLKNYSSKTGLYDLYRYRGRKFELIDEEVELMDFDID